jgi:hypothetical protein
MAVTRSKLGGEYPTAFIQSKDKEHHDILKELRALPQNKQCAECTAQPSTWASVNLGVFVCMNCAQVHRNLGTHISKVKSCMGTYLWCPDEIERMRQVGNARAWSLYCGGATQPVRKPAMDSAFEERDAFARDKYERHKWLHPGGMAAVLAEASPHEVQHKQLAKPSAQQRATTAAQGGRRNTAARDAARRRVHQMRRAPTADEGGWGSFDDWPSPTTAVLLPPPPTASTSRLVPVVHTAPPSIEKSSIDDFFSSLLPPAVSAAPAASGLIRQGSCGAASGDLIDLFSATYGW